MQVWKDAKRFSKSAYKKTSGKLNQVASYDPNELFEAPAKTKEKEKEKENRENKEKEQKREKSTVQVVETKENDGNVLTPAEMEQGRQTVLEASNKYRQLHNAPPLTLDSNMNKFSQEWAEYLIKNGKFEHRKPNQYGENLAFGVGLPVESLVKMWYDEIKDYNFAKPGFAMATGHFTALVWKDSKRVGVGLYKNADGKLMLVANYDPPGNCTGFYMKNVKKQGASTEEVVNDVNQLTSSEMEEGIKVVLEASNKCRQLHNAPPLSVDPDMNKFSQEWADYLAKNDKFEHRRPNNYGENLAYGYGNCVETLVKMWYDEIKEYDFEKPGFAMSTGHFTALVWKDSKRMGVGLYKTSSDKVYLVANYDPPGNVQGCYVENVEKKQLN